MSILVCPLCGCADYEEDDDGIILYCYNCEENANGYSPDEICEEDEVEYG